MSFFSSPIRAFSLISIFEKILLSEQFTQIVRMNAWDKLKLTLWSEGETILLNGSNVSGFTIEAIGK